jgi:exocyst complex protein 7
MNFLRHLCDHIQPLKVLLASRTTTNTNTSTNSTTTNPMNVGTFIESIVLQLCDHLTTKSTQFTSSAIGTSNVSTSTFSGQDFQYLFLVNNFAYIGTAILHLTFESEPADSRELLTKQLRTLLGPKIEANKNQAIQHFIQSSYSLFENLLSEIPSEKIVFTKKKFTNTTSSNALLTLESGRLFKDRFTKFNNLMEEFTKRHKLFKVYDPNIHHLLVQEANRAILPRYTNFYTKYSKLQFSKKNMTKYLKYTPKQVEEILTQQLFTGK